MPTTGRAEERHVHDDTAGVQHRTGGMARPRVPRQVGTGQVGMGQVGMGQVAAAGREVLDPPDGDDGQAGQDGGHDDDRGPGQRTVTGDL